MLHNAVPERHKPWPRRLLGLVGWGLGISTELMNRHLAGLQLQRLINLHGYTIELGEDAPYTPIADEVFTFPPGRHYRVRTYRLSSPDGPHEKSYYDVREFYDADTGKTVEVLPGECRLHDKAWNFRHLFPYKHQLDLLKAQLRVQEENMRLDYRGGGRRH